MRNAQFSIDEFLGMLRRRKAQFIIPAILIMSLCTVAAYLLPKKYESSTTILAQGDQVLNPLVNYTMAVTMATDDPLQNFNQIVYSRPIIEALIDSLGMQSQLQTPAQTEMMIKNVSSNIKTAQLTSNTFSISYYDGSPRGAQRAVSVLADLYIQRNLGISNMKNEFAVQFFSKKLDELRDKFEESQRQLVEAMKQHAPEIPESQRIVYSHIDDFDKQVSAIQVKIKNYQQALSIIQQQDISEANGKLDLEAFYQLPVLNVPYATELQTAVSKYENLAAKYTSEYPDVRNARAEVMALLGRVKNAIQSELSMDQNQSWELEKERDAVISTVDQATVSQSQDQDVKSDFDLYKELYNDMKVKLEQAETSLDLGQSGAEGYVVINPPQIPTVLAKPNKALIIGGGFSLGLFIGLLSAGLAELLDTRVRRSEDIEIYNKPIIAYLPPIRSSQDK
ncbi:MAG: Wzz/FepE/Etk N-terminal domain-containing protein [Candidatus Kryptoniota bacterium]